MQIQKLKLAAYAMGKKLQGYHLLRNPKTSSPLELTMLRTEKSVHTNGDIVTWHDRISRDFEKKTKPVKETLITKHYYSDSSESKIEPFRHYINSTKGIVKSKGVELEYKNRNKDLPWDEYYKVSKKAHDSYYSPFGTGIERFLARMLYNVDDKPIRPNFFKVLFSNLAAKAK